MRISDWSSDVCSSDLAVDPERAVATVFTALEAAGAEVARHRDPAVLPKAIKNDTELGGTRAAHVRDGVAGARFLKWMEEGEHGSASCRERGCQDVEIPVVGGSLKKNCHKNEKLEVKNGNRHIDNRER